LRKITQFGDLLLQEYDSKLDEDGKYYVNVMSNSAYRMSRLIRGLLDYSTASNHEIELEEVSLSELLSDIVADHEVMIDDAKGAVEVGELPLIHADRFMASSLFGNIVSNGLKYRDAHRAPIVKVISTEVDGAYEITVSDNGVGFDNRQCDKIFEPFARLHKRSDFDGSGIGLAICRSVCDRHGWSMRAISEIGSRSAFTARIPIPAESGKEL
jgi:light-regulated signal transduction histidine kinase (bacteriophytochrome)